MTNATTATDFDTIIETVLIRDLVEQYPDLMPILSDTGIDLCCGGGHPVAEAARLHGLDLSKLREDVAAVVLKPRG